MHGVVDQVARGVVIGPVGDDVVVLDDLERVGRRHRALVADDVHVRVDVGEAVLADAIFGRPMSRVPWMICR